MPDPGTHAPHEQKFREAIIAMDVITQNRSSARFYKCGTLGGQEECLTPCHRMHQEEDTKPSSHCDYPELIESQVLRVWCIGWPRGESRRWHHMHQEVNSCEKSLHRGDCTKGGA
eukprot:1161145-Pelagomonas_calceolata.AAC.6